MFIEFMFKNKNIYGFTYMTDFVKIIIIFIFQLKKHVVKNKYYYCVAVISDDASVGAICGSPKIKNYCYVTLVNLI